MTRLILEFWTDRKEAEIPMDAMTDWTPRQVESFERIQEMMGRRTLLRMEDGDAV